MLNDHALSAHGHRNAAKPAAYKVKGRFLLKPSLRLDPIEISSRSKTSAWYDHIQHKISVLRITLHVPRKPFRILLHGTQPVSVSGSFPRSTYRPFRQRFLMRISRCSLLYCICTDISLSSCASAPSSSQAFSIPFASIRHISI